MGAAIAVVVVAVTGIVVRAPLAKVPENAMKFAVGIMLTTFGTFWGAEGAGVGWPGGDAALLVLVPVVAAVSLGYAAWLRRANRPSAAAGGPSRRRPVEDGRGDGLMMRALKSFGAFWYDFVIGDDWQVAAGGGRAGPHRAARARGRGERLVAAPGGRVRRAGLVPAPRDGR